MARTTTVSESVHISAPPDVVYEKVSDPRNMGRWSPENTGATLIDSPPLKVGDAFWGTNRRGLMRWATYCRVTAAEPGRRFAFEVLGQRVGGGESPRLRFDIATWQFEMHEVDGGTRLTETWKDERDSTLFGRVTRRIDRMVTGGRSFPDLHRDNIKETLNAIKREVEGSVRS